MIKPIEDKEEVKQTNLMEESEVAGEDTNKAQTKNDLTYFEEQYEKKEKKKRNEYLKAKQFCFTQIWIVQLPSLFTFFVKEKIFGQKERSNKSSMQWFCD